ncbi:MAG: DUF3631 domain-containing protein [Candidatus Sericytochromatia bacterium]
MTTAGVEWLPMEAVEGAALLDKVAATLRRFVAFPSPEACDATALWAVHTHVVEVFESTPRLALLSPEPGSGKTRVLEVLELLVPRPMLAFNASTAAVFRSIEAEHPTLLFDEVDAIFGRRAQDEGAEDHLRGLLNAGHRRGTTIPRCVGKSMEVRRFVVYAAVALAGLGDLPDTLMSRSIIIRMRRRAPHEDVEQFRHRLVAEELGVLQDYIAEWTASIARDLEYFRPELPEGITDRPADCWEPIVAIADVAGGDWPERARRACVELNKVAESREASLGVRLLADLRTAFGAADGLHTETILDQLHNLDEAPWSDLRGKPLDARGLAHRLRAYDVHSRDVKVAGINRKGYRREDLHDVWIRYLPPDRATGATKGTAEDETAGQDGYLAVAHEVAHGAPVAHRWATDPARATGNDASDLQGNPGSSGSSPAENNACANCGHPLDTLDHLLACGEATS